MSAGSDGELERLYRQVEEHHSQHDHASAMHKFSVAYMEGQISVAQAHLLSVRIRNAELANRAAALESALQQTRQNGGRFPSMRKRPIRERLRQMLQSVGLEHIEAMIAASPLLEVVEEDTIRNTIVAERWRPTATLCSHLDGVRALACSGDVLVSAGEDAIVKVWDLSRLRGSEDLEPLASYRGTRQAVLSVACRDRRFFAGGADGTIRAYGIVDAEYDQYDAATAHRVACTRMLSGHTDAVWSLALHPVVDLLASASADGTIRLWTRDESEVVTCPDGDVSPTSVVWAQSALLAGVSDACVLFDVERGLPLQRIDLKSQVTCLAFQKDMAVSGHEDGARLFSPTGQVRMKLGGEHVSCVAFDPAGNEVLTGSHNGCIRLFDIRTGRCLHEVALHSQKYEEAIHSVCHTGERIITAGADANIVLLGKR